MNESRKMPSGSKEKLLSFYKRMNGSIYYRFNFAMISLTVSMLLIIGLLSFGFMRYLVVQNILQTLDSDIDRDSKEFENTMNLISESLINISGNLIITNAIVDTVGREAYIIPFMKSFKLPNDISVKLTLCDFMGKPLASNVRNPREFNSPELLQRTIEEGKGFVELVKNDNETVLLMALPVIWVMTNKPEGVLVAEMNMGELFANALHSFNISDDRSISLLSGNTVLLEKNKKAEASFFQSKKPLRLAPPLDRMALQVEINDYRKIKTGWLVGLYCVAGLLFIFVSLLVSKKISFRLTDRLTILSDAAKRIAENGSLDITAEVKGYDEVTALAIAFNEMIGRVRETRDSLELRVEELHSVTQRLTLSTQSAKLGIWDWDITNNSMGWDDRMVELHGLSRETFSGGIEAWQSSLHPEDRDKTIEECQAALRGEKEWDIEFRILHPNGTLKYIKANGIVIRDSEGTPIRMLGISRDISERKQAEEALKNSLSLLSASLESTADGILIVNKQGKIARWNQKFAEMWMIPENVLLSHEDEKAINHILTQLADPDRFISKVQELYEQPEQSSFDQIEFLDGRVFERYSQPQRIEDTIVGRVWSFRDITARKQAEEEKAKLEEVNRQFQKTESLNRMAGAIAHHFNNQLAVVMGNLEMAISDLSPNEPSVKLLNAAMGGACKSVELSSLMLAYLGQIIGKHAPQDLSEICRQSLPLLLAAAPKNITFKVDLPSPGPTVNADKNQMQQVLTNLVTNAWEAAPEKHGDVHLALNIAHPIDIPKAHRFPVDWQSQDNPYASLEVSDQGCGISEADIDNIFDPFFSSKFTGRGLGLPVVLGIVKAHGGVVTVRSEVGCGSTFNVFLPISTEEIPKQRDEIFRPFIKEGVGTVLLVEDEEMMREMARTMLMRLGFAVHLAKDGVEAVEVFRAHLDEINVVLCDLSMPRMNGWETLSVLRGIRPDIPVVLASGHDESKVISGDHLKIPNQVFLHKPYQKAALKDALAKAVERKPYPSPKQDADYQAARDISWQV